MTLGCNVELRRLRRSVLAALTRLESMTQSGCLFKSVLCVSGNNARGGIYIVPCSE